MGWTPFQLVIAFLMLITGSLNTLIAKWTDDLEAVGRIPHTEQRKFNHPFLQACAMFLGEFLCLVAFAFIWIVRRQRSRSQGLEAAEVTLGEGQEHFTWRKSLVFLPPALCDMTATSIMYVGLNMTYASSFQMLRGAVIIFTALLSVAFLNNRLTTSKWVGMFIVIAGLVSFVTFRQGVHPRSIPLCLNTVSTSGSALVNLTLPAFFFDPFFSDSVQLKKSY